ncbi:histidine kinase [Flavobacterium oreochromis]|uniref:Histidine kinase n=2 Tax=Flavobacterium TaxID=237 RepID=A0A246GAR6_9FLAO|nr:histidine kinase [Flavobacterium oreochromis]OWP74738.1 histidine kinase [Flavobacterium oreochromis]OWP77300.1 histidine kinase [Flavobacterium oreochromis]POR21132.1 histidine kinase [Flavobacterium columnare]QYS87371.1 Hpt domain-containing protein [Flavobacterium oreochromis]
MENPNENYIRQLSGDNTDFRAKIITIIKEEFPEETSIYKDHIDTKNFLQAASSVHKLKHKISILGMEKSYYIAEEFEKNLLEKSTNLQIEFEAILKTMQEFIDQL